MVNHSTISFTGAELDFNNYLPGVKKFKLSLLPKSINMDFWLVGSNKSPHLELVTTCLSEL